MLEQPEEPLKFRPTARLQQGRAGGLLLQSDSAAKAGPVRNGLETATTQPLRPTVV